MSETKTADDGMKIFGKSIKEFLIWWNAATFEIGGLKRDFAAKLARVYINELEKVLLSRGRDLGEFFVNLSRDGSISEISHQNIMSPSGVKEFYRSCLWGMSIPYTLPIALDMASPVGKRVLDLGCGLGRLSVLCALRGAKWVDAADLSVPLINSLKRTIHSLNLSNIEAKVVDAENPKYESNHFDVIYFCEVIEHLPHPEKALSSIRSLLKKDGRLILSTPNGLNLIGFRQSLYKAFGLKWKSPYGSGQPELHTFTPMSLSKLLNDNGYEMIELRGAELIDNFALIYPSNLAIGITQFLPIMFRPFRKLKEGLVRLGKTRLFRNFGLELFVKAVPLRK